MENSTLTVADALRQTRDLDRVYSALERRTLGLSWVIWGMAVTGIFMTYSFLGVLQSAANAQVHWIFPLAWVPWTAMAWIAMALLWRSVAISAPSAIKMSWKEGAAAGVLFVVFIAGSLYLVPILGIKMVEPALILVGLGDALAAVGLLGLFTKARGSRVLWLIGGAALAVVGIVGSLAWGADTAAAYAGFSLLAPLSVAVVFFGNGIYLAMKD